MPIKIESFEPLSGEEFAALRQQQTRKTDPAMAARKSVRWRATAVAIAT